MGLVWSDKFKSKSIFLERGTAGNKIAWHKRWIGSTVLGGSDLALMSGMLNLRVA